MTLIEKIKYYWKRRKFLFSSLAIAGVVTYKAKKKSKFHLGKRSTRSLEGVQTPMVKVVNRAIEITHVDFMVTEGKRTLTRQRELVRTGKSTTMNSRHLTGHAVDIVALVDGEIDWENWNLYISISKAMKKAAEELGVLIVWGGDWKSRDGPHFQLDWARYPK